MPGVLAATVQLTWALSVAAHDAAGSPSLTVRLMVAVPGALQVKVGLWAAASLMVPPLAFQAKVSGAGPASLSWAAADRAMLPPGGLPPAPVGLRGSGHARRS